MAPGKLDITNVQIDLPESDGAGGPIIVTGKYALTSVPACGGCKVTAYIGVVPQAEPYDPRGQLRSGGN